MENTNKQTREKAIIYSQKLAGYLMLHGVRLLWISPDHADPRKNVFFFYDNERLQELIKEWDKIRFDYK